MAAKMLYFIVAAKPSVRGFRIVEENIKCIDHDRAFDRFEEFVELSVDPEEEFFLGMHDEPTTNEQGGLDREVIFICSSRTGTISSIADLPVWLLPDSVIDALLESGAFDS